MAFNDTAGDINIFEYIWQAHDNEAILQQRAVVFSTNAIKVGIITAKYPYKLAPWCCLLANTTGALSNICFGIFTFFTYGPTCHAVAWATVTSLTISTVLTNIMLLERAYLAYRRSKLFILLGIFLILVPAPIYMIAIWWCADIGLSNRYGCYMKFAFYLPYFRLLLDLPCNLVCSAVFSTVIYKYYKKYRDDCWKRLARNGIITMILVILSNIICFFLNLKSTKNLYFVSQTATAKNFPTKSCLKKKIYSVDSVQETEISMWPTELQSMRR
ncbi:hypothetical protein BDF19DRAFT_443124 [Syncephalis fuscata]|nr:hypothetical protein BDF19DRAFT_443124 [Syncephalis fuscata]